RLVGAVALDDRRDLLGFLGELLVGGGVLHHGRLRHLRLDLAEAVLDVLQLLERDGVHRPVLPRPNVSPRKNPGPEPVSRGCRGLRWDCYAWAGASFFLPYLRV